MIFESAVLTVALWCLPDKRTPGNLPTLLGWSPQYMKGCPMTSAFTYRPTVTNRLTVIRSGRSFYGSSCLQMTLVCLGGRVHSKPKEYKS